jgi:nucleotide-binding universal stress UspA family protein
MIKDIVVNLPVETSSPAADYAVSIAGSFGARLTGIAFAYEPIIPPTDMGGIPADLIESQRAENETNSQAALNKFNAALQGAGVQGESRMIWASAGGASDVFGRIARHFDLAVVGQVEPGKAVPEELIAEGALLESGRPVVLVPYVQKAGLKLDRVMVCWDGSRNAARAVADAMPFLARAKLVEVVTITADNDKDNEFPGLDIAQNLARHDINVDARRVSAGDVDIANNILSLAADTASDFLVMGSYGHSRLREFLFGGATRGVLSAMTVPVLMSH